MKKIIANLIDAEEQRIAILDSHGKLYDFFIEHGFERQQTGAIYKAKVENIIVGMNAAFVNLGDGKNGFLYLAEMHGAELKAGNDILVQIAKNARKGKNARITPKISLAGRYLVLVPGGRNIGVSKRIEDETERQRLRAIVKENKPENFGIIIRTVAGTVSEEVLREDINDMVAQWEKIKSVATVSDSPCVVYKEAGLLERVLRDELTDEIDEIVVDTEEDYETAKTFVKQFMPNSDIEVSHYCEDSQLFDLYSIENQIAALQGKKVWLPSGANLIIDQTEALTVIDVNTAKFVGNKNLNDTAFKTNLEAAKEIARQLRLRALGGIVIIDFIDMAGEEENNRLVAELESQLKNDKCKARVFGVTGLGLVEITRKRARMDLNTELMRSCLVCAGLGFVQKEEVVAMRIKRFIRKICFNTKADALLIECHENIARYISETVLGRWEEEFAIKIILRGCYEFQWDKYRVDFQGSIADAEHYIETVRKEEGWVRVYRTSSA